MPCAKIAKSLAAGQRFRRNGSVLRITSLWQGSVYYTNETSGLTELRDPIDAVVSYIARGYWTREG